jgi:hypothetical protein
MEALVVGGPKFNLLPFFTASHFRHERTGGGARLNTQSRSHFTNVTEITVSTVRTVRVTGSY